MQTMRITRSFQDAEKSPLVVKTGALRFSRDGKRLIAGNAITVDERQLKISHRIHVWDFETGKLLHQIATPQYQIQSLDVSPDDNQIAARLADRATSLVAAWSLKDKSIAAKPEPGMARELVIAAK